MSHLFPVTINRARLGFYPVFGHDFFTLLPPVRVLGVYGDRLTPAAVCSRLRLSRCTARAANAGTQRAITTVVSNRSINLLGCFAGTELAHSIAISAFLGSLHWHKNAVKSLFLLQSQDRVVFTWNNSNLSIDFAVQGYSFAGKDVIIPLGAKP